MARLVPARPRSDTPGEEASVRALESGLDDAYVVFQKRPVQNGFLVAHPDRGLCLVMLAHGTHSFDPDAEAWSGIDLDAERSRCRGVVSAMGLDVAVAAAAHLPDVAHPGGGHPGADPRIAFAGDAASLPTRVADALRLSSALGETGIDTLIQALSPGAAPYAQGEVTEAQRRWRAEVAGSPEAPSALPGQASREADAPTPVGDVLPEVAETVALPAAPSMPEEPDITENDATILLIRQAIETVVGDKKLFAVGVSIDPGDLVDPTALLPALLVCAADDWAPVVASKAGKGGFHIRMKSDPDGLTGYRVTAINPSTPLLLLLPVMDRVRRSQRNGEFVLDETLAQFSRWLAANRFDGAAMQDIDIRVALNIA